MSARMLLRQPAGYPGVRAGRGLSGQSALACHGFKILFYDHSPRSPTQAQHADGIFTGNFLEDGLADFFLFAQVE